MVLKPRGWRRQVIMSLQDLRCTVSRFPRLRCSSASFPFYFSFNSFLFKSSTKRTTTADCSCHSDPATFSDDHPGYRKWAMQFPQTSSEAVAPEKLRGISGRCAPGSADNWILILWFLSRSVGWCQSSRYRICLSHVRYSFLIFNLVCHTAFLAYRLKGIAWIRLLLLITFFSARLYFRSI